jgi:hypothetical protein
VLQVAGGRVVLRKPANPAYGVELSAGSQADLMQVLAVGIGNPATTRDSVRDQDMETIWGAEFERLQSLVAKREEVSLSTAPAPWGRFLSR